MIKIGKIKLLVSAIVSEKAKKEVGNGGSAVHLIVFFTKGALSVAVSRLRSEEGHDSYASNIHTILITFDLSSPYLIQHDHFCYNCLIFNTKRLLGFSKNTTSL